MPGRTTAKLSITLMAEDVKPLNGQGVQGKHLLVLYSNGGKALFLLT